MNNLNNVLGLIKRKIKELQQTEPLRFQDIIKPNFWPQGGKLQFPGVYIIYEKGGGVIYVGSTGKGGRFLKDRLAELFYYNKAGKDPSSVFAHSLTQKFLTKIKRFRDIDSLRQFYLQKCYLRIIKTQNVREARIIEDILIVLLNPKYNSE